MIARTPIASSRFAIHCGLGPIFTPPIVSSLDGPLATIQVPSEVGGANWPGGSFDPETGMLYIYSHTLVRIPAGAALVAPKHQCMLDVFAQFTWLPASAFVMKKELAWIPWFGWYARKAGAIVIDREGGSTTMRQVIREGTELFKHGRQVVIFPEGTRKAPGAPPDYKPGIAALYRELNVPVHPVATNAGVHWPAHGFIRRPGTIVFEYLEPIPPGLKRAEFMRVLEERIETKSPALLAL